jgi:hypothetical protein
VEDFPRAEELEKNIELTVKEYTTDGEIRFGLFSEQAGPVSEMKTKLEKMEDAPYVAFVHCFDR